MNRHVSTMEVMNTSGHTTVTWDPTDAASVATARAEFNRLRREGYTPWRMAVDHEEGNSVTESKGERMTTFDPEAGRVLMMPQLRGG